MHGHDIAACFVWCDVRGVLWCGVPWVARTPRVPACLPATYLAVVCNVMHTACTARLTRRAFTLQHFLHMVALVCCEWLGKSFPSHADSH